MTDGEPTAENVLSVMPDYNELTKRAFILEFNGKVTIPMLDKLKSLSHVPDKSRLNNLMDLVEMCIKVETMIQEDMYSRKALQSKLLEARLERDRAKLEAQNLRKEIRALKKSINDLINLDGVRP